ncbi:integrase catalytic domain-containing protein [Trichonephila clavipes]|nr:integrase catalytic domain-containing protein [Trichonephila clavipes]
MGHMEEVVEDEDSAIVYYLPHHGVYHQESKTAPLRDDLIDESQRDLLRIVWKDKIDSLVKIFRLTTVTYGTKSAPYLATRSLKQLAIDDGDKYPLAAEVIMSDVYMDDLTGADDLESGRKLQVQLVSMLKGAGMELYKWSANPKTIGLLWKPHPDSFAFKISPMTSNCDNLIVTKKSVISTIARIFDPLGLIGPVITRAKILLRSLRQLKLDWNDPLPSNLVLGEGVPPQVSSTSLDHGSKLRGPSPKSPRVAEQCDVNIQSINQSNLVFYWKSFIDALESINYLDIPRYCLQDKSIRTELHGFSGSSEKAYGAALYLRCINTSREISVRLLCSKSMVAPMIVNISQIYLWTDSSIVLAWIKKPLAQLKTFVRNRVSIIQKLTESDFWKHVNSENNPADILSRGISPDKIQHCELWWFGPPFLRQYKELEPYDITAVEGDDLFLQELKETSDFPPSALLKNFEPLDIISNCSSFTKLQRVIAWCKRFIENARHPMSRTMGPIKSTELYESLKCIVKNIQRTSFYNEIQYLEKGIPLPNSCAEATLANIRNSFWIPSARNVVRKILRTYIICRKVSTKGSQQLMADLLTARVTACRVFIQVVKAIHLEIVSDLTTEAFLAAFKRFVARRGRPIEIHSDNGRNFVEQIKWNFNPPYPPHFGGLWEAGVKSLKYHLKRVIGNSILSHEEFLNLVVQIEAVLNSRPICPLFNDTNDVETLTPAHFLVGSSLVAVPDPDYTEIPMNRLSQW